MERRIFMEILEDLLKVDADDGLVDECKMTGDNLSVRMCDGSCFIVVVKERN